MARLAEAVSFGANLNLMSSQFSASLWSEHTYSDHSWGCLPQPGTKHRGEGIPENGRRRDFRRRGQRQSGFQYTVPIDHDHLARNCSIKIITPAVKASVISIIWMVVEKQHLPGQQISIVEHGWNEGIVRQFLQGTEGGFGEKVEFRQD